MPSNSSSSSHSSSSPRLSHSSAFPPFAVALREQCRHVLDRAQGLAQHGTLLQCFRFGWAQADDGVNDLRMQAKVAQDEPADAEMVGAKSNGFRRDQFVRCCVQLLVHFLIGRTIDLSQREHADIGHESRGKGHASGSAWPSSSKSIQISCSI